MRILIELTETSGLVPCKPSLAAAREANLGCCQVNALAVAVDVARTRAVARAAVKVLAAGCVIRIEGTGGTQAAAAAGIGGCVGCIHTGCTGATGDLDTCINVCSTHGGTCSELMGYPASEATM